MSASPIFLGTVKSPGARILPADSTNLVTLWTPGANGSKVLTIGASSTDTSDRDVAFYLTKGGVDYLLGTIKIPLNSGNANNIPSVDVLAHPNLPAIRLDADGARYLWLEVNAVLRAKALVAVTAAKEIDFFMYGGDA
jgi:hypothetical protein